MTMHFQSNIACKKTKQTQRNIKERHNQMMEYVKHKAAMQEGGKTANVILIILI